MENSKQETPFKEFIRQTKNTQTQKRFESNKHNNFNFNKFHKSTKSNIKPAYTKTNSRTHACKRNNPSLKVKRLENIAKLINLHSEPTYTHVCMIPH